ncbi:40S ribosomal protein S8 [Trypanosoma rangeli SC58]|uniref:40S ribosomal protein S8 n=1 Tax=Trypanosoma rangeli SC58 TaxID=429131 RepID=A0A061JAH2_TRYRA|nr:40S ribosomal protein S8 [Trypanosoma rangeli SC58]
MDALENVSLPMTIAGTRSAAEIKERAKDLLVSVGLGDRLYHFPSMLSGGEQQRVTIARALVNDPEILLLDEPTGDLDRRNTILVMNILTKLNRDKGLTMVMVTHDVNMKQYSHRVLYLRDGKLQRVETVDPRVREMALNKLKKDAEKALKGISDDKALKVESVVRNPADYATAAAQCQMSFEDDPGMQEVMKVLFGA